MRHAADVVVGAGGGAVGAVVVVVAIALVVLFQLFCALAQGISQLVTSH